jgi:hypothetical protein
MTLRDTCLTPEGGDDPSKVCITIIDTIILTNYTNDAYTYDTYDTHTYDTNDTTTPLRPHSY